ncbi:MAG: ABC transporter ATP-binding protein [Candidatus Sericytochromatia bacterium]|nr:ABC transporter ATP-binding protein [Candidatus Sericytochromatia bacterium]
MSLLEAKGLCRHHVTDGEVVRALDGVDLRIEAGDHLALTGPSGSGKSTLLNLLGGLERPTAGQLWFRGRDLAVFDPDELAAHRLRHVGMVFQSFQLLTRMTALENVMLPLRLAGVPTAERVRRATEFLEAVGLAARTRHRPNQMSGGEQQRVAIARALVMGPDLLLADEPTGNLDTARADDIMGLLEQIRSDRGITLVVVTHDPAVAARAGRVLKLRDGRLVGEAAA